MSQDNEIWNWHSDTHGRVISVSSGFTSCFGTSAAKDIIGSYFWTFAERLENPSGGWIELDNAFRRHEKLTKFIFHYQTQAQEKIKIALSGEPVFDKNKYIGFSGIGYTADNSEISIPELSQNMLSLSVENLNIGVAIFSREIGLVEFNQYFLEHLNHGKVKVVRNISFDSVLSTLGTSLKLIPEISFGDTQKSQQNTLVYEIAHKNVLLLKKITLENGLVLVKSEIDTSLLKGIHSYTNTISELTQKNRMLDNRIEEYKNKLSDFFNKNTKHDDYHKKILSFLENNIDVGVFITNNDGTVDTVNYVMAQMFGFTTVSMLYNNMEKDTDFQSYLQKRTKNIKDLTDNNLNRFEHIFAIDNYVYQGNVKEAILFYPSVYAPQKVISLFYPETQSGTLSSPNNNIHDSQDKEQEFNYINQQFIEYIVSDIKNSVNVINGYQELQSMSAIVMNDANLKKSNIQTQQSCNDILRSISDVMRLSKISSDMLNFNHSIFYCQDVIQECINNFECYITENNLSVKLEVKSSRLLLVTDREIFHNAIEKILEILFHTSDAGAKVRIKVIENPYMDKMEIVIVDDAHINIEEILKTDIHDIFSMPSSRYTGSLNFKIAENYLKLLDCTITALYQEDRGNTITIKISDDIITLDEQRDSDNLMI